MASPAVHFKTNYAVSIKIEPFYKGGKVQINKDGTCMFCTCGTKVNIVDIGTGKVTRSIEQEDQEDITCFSLSPDDEILVTSSRALLLKQWDWKENACTRTWKAIHTSPVASMAFDSTSTLLATGGCDSTIKIWDVIKQYCTHNLKGSSGVVHLVEFHPDISRLQLFSSSMDYKIRLWNLSTSKCMMVLDAHYSSVTSLAFTPDGNTLVSSGRDKIYIVWDLKTYKSERTVPVYETVEAVVLLPENEDFTALGVTGKEPHLITAGSKGILRVWEAYSGRCVYSQCVPGKLQKVTEGDADEQSLTHCAIVPATQKLTTVTAEHNILTYDLCTLNLTRQFVGYNDEVLDVKFLGPSDTHIVVATNSPQLKVFELATLNCQILYGHTDTVLALDVFKKGTKFASCSKDKTVRIWKMSKTTGEVNCVAQGLGHAHSIGIISCSRLKEGFIISGSQDCTLKLWNLTKSIEVNSKKAAEPEIFHAELTEQVHDKDINSVVVSPNDKLVATGSQDRTAKLWSTSDFSLIGVFRGHTRGIWSVQFSPMDQILATSSADGTVKLWGLQDFNCLKTFEGHDASVLKTIFVSRGTQLLTSASDGLLKLWTIKTNECVKTLDAHENKVWGLHCNKKDDMVVSGAADSCIIIWKDVTEIELAEEQAKQEDQILKHQELSNLMHEKKYVKALGLAISLDQPQTVLTVIKAIFGEAKGRERLESTILKLRQDQKESVLKFCIVWNTNSKHCHEAQCVVQILLQNETPEQLLQYNGIKGALEGLIPYTERHFQRVNRLLQASMFLDYMWQSMRLTGSSCDSDIHIGGMEIDPFFSMDKAAIGAGKAAITPGSDCPQGSKKQEVGKNVDIDSDSSASNRGNGHKQKHLLSACEHLKENSKPAAESQSDSEEDTKSSEQRAKTSVRKIKQTPPSVRKKTISPNELML
ncbi:transducin beta-like protein 3 [Chiloscyllium punctatum]|uniref:transducin beta-like protein 3 n=1 Tax=Chiloscyllium punctatum TaxID=137246 RepID=UPI003B6356A5